MMMQYREEMGNTATLMMKYDRLGQAISFVSHTFCIPVIIIPRRNTFGGNEGDCLSLYLQYAQKVDV